MFRLREKGLSIAIIAVAAIICASLIALFWPGVAVFDTIRQYQQVVSGQYDDWHPPIMARLWAGLEAIGLHGSAPMLVLQMTLLWAGLALVALAFVRSGSRRVGLAVLLIGLFPIVADWMIDIVKDSQLVAAMIAATGLVAFHRLRGRAMPVWAVALVMLLLGYAMLVRANSAFAAVPLAWSWQGWAVFRRLWQRSLLVPIGLAAVFLVSPAINHRLLGATDSHVENSLPVFDLAGIAHFAPLTSLPGVPAGQWHEAVERRCYTPFYWDPFADETQCGDIGDALTDDSRVPSLNRAWIAMILQHPIAYAEHRLAHVNANLRVFVPWKEASTAAPDQSQINVYDIGIGKTPTLSAFTALTRKLCHTPIGSPFAWMVLAAALGWALLATPRQPARELGLALALSALVMTASFAVVSIASDLRYHLWLIVATSLAGAMTAACDGVPRRRLLWGAGVLAMVCLVEMIARLVLTGLPGAA